MDLATATSGGYTIKGTSAADVAALLEQIALNVEDGTTTPAEAVRRIRALGGAFLDFADWFENHYKFMSSIGVILLAVVPLLREASLDAVGSILSEVSSHYEQISHN